jgi:hypothetical protein
MPWPQSRKTVLACHHQFIGLAGRCYHRSPGVALFPWESSPQPPVVREIHAVVNPGHHIHMFCMAAGDQHNQGRCSEEGMRVQCACKDSVLVRRPRKRLYPRTRWKKSECLKGQWKKTPLKKAHMPIHYCLFVILHLCHHSLGCSKWQCHYLCLGMTTVS